jgi:RNA ligase (TIGR02306 family)
MSDLVVKVVQVEKIEPHSNADRLEIVNVGGWQIVSGKGNYKVGDLVVHIPPECMVPMDWAKTWAVDQYLHWTAESALGRVRAIKLRGQPSYGFLVPNESNAALETDLATHYGIIKYEPPEPTDPGQMARENPLFPRYTDIQNLRNYKQKLNYDEPLIVTEKLHGMNSRVGFIWNEETKTYEKAIGSHRVQKKIEYAGTFGLPFEKYGKELETFFEQIASHYLKFPEGPPKAVIFYGEIIGPKVQDLKYGLEAKDWRIFDIVIDGKYIDFPTLQDICDRASLPMVPWMPAKHYTFEELVALAEGESILCPGQIKEGIVVRPINESEWKQGEQDPNPKRVIFKLISSDYLCRKGGTEYH